MAKNSAFWLVVRHRKIQSVIIVGEPMFMDLIESQCRTTGEVVR